jgi:hypothetical protein
VDCQDGSSTGSTGRPGRVSQGRLYTVRRSRVLSPDSPISLLKSASSGFP